MPFEGYDVLWVTLDPDKIKPCTKNVKKLTVLCAEKLVTDVLLVEKYCDKLPKSIHSLIFSTAVAKKRTLSVEQLMKFCPYEVLEMPIPDALKSLHTFPQIKSCALKKEIIDVTRISMTMLSVFFDIIKQNKSNSELQILDLGLFPLCKYALIRIHEFLFQERARIPLFTRTYTLKCTVAVENPTDLHIIRVCAEKSASLGFDLKIIGVCFYNDHLTDVEVIKLFDCLEKTTSLLNLMNLFVFPKLNICMSYLYQLCKHGKNEIIFQNLQLVAFTFANLLPSFDSFFTTLKFFRSVKCINFSYLLNLLTSEEGARKLALQLTELTNLQRLVLKGTNLLHMLPTLLLEYCKRNLGVSAPDCCFLHSGLLHLLDISSCNLSVQDLEFLRELSVTNSLKYLDVSENSLQEKRTFEILLYLKHSLQALNIENCFKHLIDYDDAVMPFSAFTQLKYLNIKGLRVSENSKHLLEEELQKMPSLEIIETSIPVSLTDVVVS